VIFVRGLVLLCLNILKALVNGVVLLLIFGWVPFPSPAVVLVFLITQVGVFGLAFIIVGLNLVYKNVESVTFILSTALLFVTGG